MLIILTIYGRAATVSGTLKEYRHSKVGVNFIDRIGCSVHEPNLSTRPNNLTQQKCKQPLRIVREASGVPRKSRAEPSVGGDAGFPKLPVDFLGALPKNKQIKCR